MSNGLAVQPSQPLGEQHTTDPQQRTMEDTQTMGVHYHPCLGSPQGSDPLVVHSIPPRVGSFKHMGTIPLSQGS